MQDWNPLSEEFYQKIKSTDPPKAWHPLRNSIIESLLVLYKFDDLLDGKYTRIVDSVRKTVKVEFRESSVQEINEAFKIGGLCLDLENHEIVSSSLDSCYIITAVAYCELKFSVSIGDSKRRGNSLHVENEVFKTNQQVPVAFKADLFPVDPETGELGMRMRHDGSELREGRWKKLVRKEEKALRVPVDYQYTESSRV
ncbi:Oidioi.mRNA.OKI2018_I69.chr1.g3697.t1.cds [Oikopleura dioica]|uniref:Oidioi.mRNA.OKI2018_I69.chr1.g3697.t1.cds n=1 Tax=Oikopleura dioica TaxID=34765 RepID=A0ABN7SV15_OIKDI|nr:Oidioi.mRNA.OKI2018_I69.chr1.g3697.t1.cds [Oikopleura dioica]